MQPQFSVEDVKKIFITFSQEEKIRLLRELETDMFRVRLNKLMRRLNNVPLSYDEIKDEVEHVREQRYRS